MTQTAAATALTVVKDHALFHKLRVTAAEAAADTGEKKKNGPKTRAPSAVKKRVRQPCLKSQVRLADASQSRYFMPTCLPQLRVVFTIPGLNMEIAPVQFQFSSFAFSAAN